MRNRYLVCYDISDPVRLRKVHKTMEAYGEALQYSVFCCELGARQKVEMESRLSELIHHREDRVLIVDLGPASANEAKSFQFMGKRGPVVRNAVLIV